jgi:hypothetical protein
MNGFCLFGTQNGLHSTGKIELDQVALEKDHEAYEPCNEADEWVTR